MDLLNYLTCTSCTINIIIAAGRNFLSVAVKFFTNCAKILKFVISLMVFESQQVSLSFISKQLTRKQKIGICIYGTGLLVTKQTFVLCWRASVTVCSLTTVN